MICKIQIGHGVWIRKYFEGLPEYIVFLFERKIGYK